MSDVKQYNILSAKAFGEPFDSRAGKLQRYYLRLEGFDEATIAWDKKADGGAPQTGPVWGYLTDETTKAGKPYQKFHKQSAPDGATFQNSPKAAGQSVSVSASRDAITWGEAVVAASHTSKSFDDILSLAQKLYESRPTEPDAEPSLDVVLDDIPSKIDLDDIPF